MKLFILLTALFSFHTLACSTYEAQFSSRVKEVVQNEDYSCLVKLDMNLSQGDQSWQPHRICPLDIEVVLDQFITVRHCNFEVGDSISGYVIQTSTTLEID